MKSLVENKWVCSSEMVDVINPVSGEVLEKVPNLSSSDITKNLRFAKKNLGKWQDKALAQRCEIIEVFSLLVHKNKDELAKMYSLDAGIPLKKTKEEILKIETRSKYLAEEIKHEKMTMVSEDLVLDVKMPLGTILCLFEPYFKAEDFLENVVLALLRGNAVLICPSSLSPIVLTRLVELLIEAGVPAGIVSVMHTSDDNLLYSKALEEVSHVIVCGMVKGLEVLKKFQKESSSFEYNFSKDVLVVCHDADLALASDYAIDMLKRFDAFKICLLSEKVKDKFEMLVKEKMRNIRVCIPWMIEADVGAFVTPDYLEWASCSWQGEILQGGRKKNCYLQPTLLKVDDYSKDIWGPVLPVLKYLDFAEVENALSDNGSSLNVAIFSENTENINRLAKNTDAFVVSINPVIVKRIVKDKNYKIKKVIINNKKGIVL